MSGNSTINLTVDIEGIGSGSDLVNFELDFVTKEEFQNHTDTSIPDAHDYKPDVSVSVSSSDDENTIEVSVDGESGQDTFSASTIDDYVTKDEFQKGVALPSDIEIKVLGGETGQEKGLSANICVS